MHRAISLVCFAIMAIVAGGTASGADTDRIAWVVGNATYQQLPSVAHAVNDARTVAEALRLAGYEVRDAYELDESELSVVWLDVKRTMAQQACSDCVFYFSGHAKADGAEQRFLPVDYDEDYPPFIYPSFRELFEALNAHQTDRGASVLLLDVGQAPSRSRSASFLEFDLSATTVSRTALIFSYRPDVTDAGDDEHNSPFARAIVKELRKPGLELSDFYRGIAADVRNETEGRTWPRLMGFLPRPFYFFPEEDRGTISAETADLRAAHVIVPQADGSLVPTYTTSHALLIGASHYQANATWFDLPGVEKDVAAVGKVLAEKHGFEVTTVMDPTKEDLETALAEFAAKNGSDENARLIVYYAGHGYTLGVPPLRTGWVVPVDAPDPNKDPSGFFRTALSMDQISKYSLLINAKHVLWVFDSCFSGQLIETLRGGEAPGKWETFLQTGKVRRVITSGSADQLVPDRSVFASYFVAALDGSLQAGSDDGLLTGNQLSHFLKGKVIQDRGDSQTPQFGTIKLFGAQEGDIIFRVEPPG
ncbi:MAG: caspase family protein [Rhizobiaceae bacterium]|nr:caspase family protein [Rhizobiaceae bacterium]